MLPFYILRSLKSILENKFSVIIPSYNRAATLGRAIRSVLSQTVVAWEIILVDDGSTDATRELLRSFPQVFYHYEENSGVSSARNTGAKLATGEWLIFLDSDDELDRHALSVFQEAIGRQPDAPFFVAGNKRVNFGDQTIHIPEEGIYSAVLSGSFCIRKSIFLEIGGYDPRFTFAENTELFYRVEKEGYQRVTIPKVSLVYHVSQNGGSKNSKNLINSLSLFLTKHGNSMSCYHRFLYHQILGVQLLRVGNFKQAEQQFKMAIRIRPFHLKTLIRLLLSYLPAISLKVYKQI